MKKHFYTLLKHDLFTPILTLTYKLHNLTDFSSPPDVKKVLRKVRKNTMVNYQRIKSLAQIAQKIEDAHLEGAFVECGVWRGGCSAVMAYIASKNSQQLDHLTRDVYLFDSFQGLPAVTKEDGEGAIIFANNANDGQLKPIGQNVSSEETVRQLFKDLNLDLPQVHFVKGWFQETLPVNKDKVGKIALLRLDGDWYESTKVCFENLYDKVVSGGYVVLDDYYFWEGCRKATDEFLASRNIKVQLHRVGYSGLYFVKP